MGTDELTLNRTSSHIEGTALPGETGNIGIAGHRDGSFDRAWDSAGGVRMNVGARGMA